MFTYNLRSTLLAFLCFFSANSAFATNTVYQIQGLESDALLNAQKSLNEGNNVENIKKAIQPFGYFNANVTRQNNVFIVNPGPPLRIHSLHVSVVGEGKNNPALQEYLATFPVKKNQVLLTENYKKAKKTLFNIALKQGYLTPHFEKQKILINLSRYTCDIELVLDTGPRFYFGTVTFNNVPLHEDFLRRYLPFKLGDPFSSDQLLSLQTNLAGSNYFKSVRVNSDPEKTHENKVPVDIALTMKEKHQYLTGLGFGTDSGPRATLGANFNYINGDGHYVTSQAVFSSVQNSVGINYVIPGDNPATDQYTANETFTMNHLNQGSSQTQKIGLNYIKMLSHNWQRTYSLNYNIEQFKFDNLPGESSYLVIPGVSFINTTNAQSHIFTNQGNRFSINLQGTLRQLVSGNTFAQVEIQDKAITHLTDNDRIIVRGDVGYTYTDSLSSLPLSLRFYAGGAQSIRGFSYQAIGPGKYLAVGSVEFQQRVKGNWYATTFFDVGNAMDNTDQPFARGAGVGIMWATPIGPIELTVAKAMNVPGQPARIQFTMGPDL